MNFWTWFRCHFWRLHNPKSRGLEDGVPSWECKDCGCECDANGYPV